MRNLDVVVAPTEFKFVSESEPGAFSGYGAVFNNVDSHKDLIRPGAFTETLAEHKAKGTLPDLFVEHSAFEGGDPLPVGVWREMQEDDHGLKVQGKISALDTDHGRRVRGLMLDGALKGLSIAFEVPPGGAVLGKKQGEPRRTLHKVTLHAVDIVRNPSNSAARIQELKTAFAAHLKMATDDAELVVDGPDVDAATDAVAAAILMHDRMMSGYGGGYGSGSIKDCALLMDSLRDAYKALTGERVPDGLVGWTKSVTTIREIEKILREEFDLSRTRASEIAKRRFASLPRDEGSTKAPAADTKSAFDDIGAAVSGFKLPTF